MLQPKIDYTPEIITPKTVDEFLDQVNYKELNSGSYIPSAFALKFMNFIKLVNGGEGESSLTPVVHLKMLDKIASKHDRVANLCARGMAKTTLMFEYFALYIGVFGELDGFGKLDGIIYVSDTMENGVKSARKNIEHRYENSEFLQSWMPRDKVKFTDAYIEFGNRDGGKVGIRMFGAKTGIRGTKIFGKRPQIAVLDDLVSDEDAKSKTSMDAIKDTVYKGVFYALDPKKKKIIFNGTPFNKSDILYEAVESGQWDVNVWPVCEKFPCTKEEFNGAWEDRFTFEYVLDAYKLALGSGELASFNQELMLRISSEEERLVPDSIIDSMWYSRKKLMDNIGAFNIYITTDFATTEKQNSDYSVISVWAYSSNKDWYWIDGIVKKQDMGKNLDDLFKLVGKYRPQQVGIEVSGQQGGFIPWIREKMMDRNIWFNLATNKGINSAGINPTVNKLGRFNEILPQIISNKVFIPLELKTDPRLVELVNELKFATVNGLKAKYDDVIDTISMLAYLAPWQPTDSSVLSLNPDTQEDEPTGSSNLYNMKFPGDLEETSPLSSYI